MTPARDPKRPLQLQLCGGPAVRRGLGLASQPLSVARAGVVRTRTSGVAETDRVSGRRPATGS